jgi:CRP/FNR family transcriptional regulator
MVKLATLEMACGARAASGGCAACAARPFSVCAAVPDADLARLEALAQTVALDRGQALFRQGEPAGCVYNVTSGAIRLSRLSADGRRQVMGFAWPGAFLGLARGETHFCTAEALEPSRVCRFAKPRFEALMAERRELEAALLARAGDELAAAQAQMLLLGHKTALERLAGFLLTLPDRDPLRPSGPGQVRLPMTRLEIADYLGLTIETVSRSLTRLKRLGLVRQVALNELVIPDARALAAAAGEGA